MADLTDTIICWSEGERVALVTWPDTHGESLEYRSMDGACWIGLQKDKFERRKALVFEIFVKLTAFYGCSPQKVHEVFLGLDEYVAGLPEDMRGDNYVTRVKVAPVL